MNRVEIKEKAKKLIKGNLWTLQKPMLIVFAITFAVAFIVTLIALAAANNSDTAEIVIDIVSSLVGFAIIPATVGICAYYLKFVRGEELSLDLLKKYYPFFIKLLLIDLLIFVFTLLWSLLFIIPGIIAAIGYSMSFFIAIDKEELDAMETVKESKRIMNGHKLDYFVLQLSFIGWILLAPFTLGILYIWLIPYMTVAEVLFYEEIRNK